MTVVVEQLGRAYALVAEAREATARAEAEIAAGSEIFDEGTRGSIWPQVQEMRRLGRSASDDVRSAYTELAQVQDIIDDYCFSIAGHRIGRPTVQAMEERSPGTDGSPAAVADEGDLRNRYPEWIAERERAGAVINRGSVDRMSTTPDGRTVWVERENAKGGAEHILDSDRAGQFARTGVLEGQIMDLLFAALERGKVVGYSGRDRPVYEVIFDDERRRLAITVTPDGLIVGAHPISLKRKLRARVWRD